MMRLAICGWMLVALAGCGPDEEETAKLSRDQLASHFYDVDTAQTPVVEKCRMTKELAAAYQTDKTEDVYGANQWAIKRDAYCSTSPDPKKIKEAEKELASWKQGHDDDYGQNRCAQYSLVVMAYRDAHDAQHYNEWRMKARAYCESKGWRYHDS